MSNKTYKEVTNNIKQKDAKSPSKEKAYYVDSSRNVAVCMDSKELSKALKNFDRDDDNADDGIVNSAMYRREALYFTVKKQHESARKNLALAHLLAPDNQEILASLADSLLKCGNHREARSCAEQVLHQDPRCPKAIIVKAESLYNICDFEHSLVLFTRGQYLSPDSSLVKNGISKCRKTIINKIYNENVFSFPGSAKFFDFLREEGEEATDSYINGEIHTFKSASNLAAIKQRSMKIKERNERKNKKPKGGRNDRMKADMIFLQNLEKTMIPLSGMFKDRVNDNVHEATAQMIDYLNNREEFWKQID